MVNDNECPVEAAAGWVEVRTGDGRLLFELDPGRWLVRVKRRGEGVELVDLLEYVGGKEGTQRDAEGRRAQRGLRGV